MKFFKLVVLVCLCGCAGQFKHSVNVSPVEPLRVVVLPFAERGKDGSIKPMDYSLFIDEVPLVSEKLELPPPTLIAKLVRDRLKEKTSFDLVSGLLVERTLAHHGYGVQGHLNVAKMYSAPAKEICALLSCDAVLYGYVTRWDRSYFAIESVHTVGIELSLVSALDGKSLFSSSGEDSSSRGITKGPTGFSSLVLEPIKGLDNEIIQSLASDVVDKTLAPLISNPSARPKVTEALPAIFAAAHNAKNDGHLSKREHLTVLMLGTAGEVASFSIGERVQNMPMVEKDPGHYIGAYYPLPSDEFREQIVSVQLKDKYGRTTQFQVGTGKISLQ